MRCSIVLLLFFLAQRLTLTAQVLTVSGTTTADSLSSLYLSPCDSDASVKLEVRHHAFQAALPVSRIDFYRLTCVRDGRQDLLPLYINSLMPPSLCVHFEDATPQVSGSPENEGLSAFYREVQHYQRDAFRQPDNRASMKRQLFLKADSIGQTVTEPAVTQYLHLWALAVCDSCESQSMDSPLTMCFPELLAMAVRQAGRGSLTSRMERLYSLFHNPLLRGALADRLLLDHISRYPFSSPDNYRQGVAELEAVTIAYGLDGKYLRQFQLREASVVGMPFPSTARLYDADGNEFDFSTLRGKYVYVDLWASWCVPCIREVPALKELERQLQRSDVVFLSVSIDTRKEAWTRKSAQLELKGLQLIDVENTLPKALNVRGIPFFAIYDPQGRLHTYNAPRPSHPQLLHFLEQLP